MTEDQFKRLLEENNTALIEKIDKRFGESEAKLDGRFEENNAALFGQLSQHFDERFDSLQNELKADTNRIYNTVVGITGRIDTDEQERAAIVQEQKRHSGWIHQLADATNTKLVPEQ